MTKDEIRLKKIRKVGLRVRELRDLRGWTLEETEEKGDLTWQYLQKIESGRNVTLLTLIKLAEIFKITLQELFRDL